MSEFTDARIGFADPYGTTADVSVDGDQTERSIQVHVGVGQSGATGYPTPAAARQFAAALIDAAEAVEQQ